MASLRIIFMGTPDFAVPALDALANAGHQIVAVYSQPPRPAGRGQRVCPSPVHARASQREIPVLTPVSLKTPDAQAEFAGFEADVAVVAAYGLILPQPILDAPRLGCINIHASLLPRWRGCSPIHRALLAGDRESGISIMQMDAGLDTGPVLMRQALPITPEMTAADLHDRLAALGAEMIVPAVEGAAQGTLEATPQPDQGAVYAPKLERAESTVDWLEPAETIARKARGLNPWPGFWFEVGDCRIRVLRAEPTGTGTAEPVAPGTVLDDQLTIACGDGAVRLVEVQRAGKCAMSADELLRGFAIPAGTRLAG